MFCIKALHAFTDLYMNVHTFALSRCSAELKQVLKVKSVRVAVLTERLVGHNRHSVSRTSFQNYVTPEAVLLRGQQIGAWWKQLHWKDLFIDNTPASMIYSRVYWPWRKHAIFTGEDTRECIALKCVHSTSVIPRIHGKTVLTQPRTRYTEAA